MAEAIHESAPHYLPAFIAGPGETDVLFVVVTTTLIAIVLMVGNFYFKLHALPEKMAHRANSAQLQLIGVLALLAMFTHNNVFWVAALLIAAFRVPDFSTPLNAIARSIDDLSTKIERTAVPRVGDPPALGEATPARLEAPAEAPPPSGASPAPDETDR